VTGDPLSSSQAPLILASASPRRADLLRSAGIAFVPAPVDCDEAWRAGEAPPSYAERVARAKAELALRPGAAVLAADTTVWLEGQVEPLGKPADRAAAAATLGRLAGRAHFVTTAVALVDARADAPRWHSLAVTTTVWFRPLTPAEIGAYLDADEWRDKAGGYGIQGRAAGLVRRIEGSYTNVVGLPLAEVVELLQGLGLA
jgi:septum formation protein